MFHRRDLSFQNQKKSMEAQLTPAYLKRLLKQLNEKELRKKDLRGAFDRVFFQGFYLLRWIFSEATPAQAPQILGLLKKFQEKAICSVPEVFHLLSRLPPQVLADYLSLRQARLKESTFSQLYLKTLLLPDLVRLSELGTKTCTVFQVLVLQKTTQQKHLALYFRELAGCYTRGSLTSVNYFKALTEVEVEGMRVLHYLARNRRDLLTEYLRQLEYCAEWGVASLQTLLEEFRPLALNGKEVIHSPKELCFPDVRLSNSLSRIVGLCHQDLSKLVSMLPGMRFLKMASQRVKPEFFSSCSLTRAGLPVEPSYTVASGAGDALLELKIT